MPRWKALPDELDPEVKEFAGQLRRLVDHSGLSIAAVSDRTGYSKTSWERYLNGRLLAPKGAVVALAEVTGTQPVHLITMWELAERAWSRSEMRHDMTMQAIRISQARAALGELGTSPSSPPPASASASSSSSLASSPPSASPAAPPSSGPKSKSKVKAKARNGSGGVGSLTGVAGPAGVSPTVPPQAPQAPQAPPSYGTAASSPYGDASGAPPAGSPDRQRRRRKLTMFLAGVVGALVVIAAAVFLTDLGGGGKEKDETKPTVAPSTSETDLPAGVECSGADCAGKDPENMGCGGELAKTASRATVGRTLIEVRYSKTCGAAWARITQATPGDKVTITGSGKGASAKQNGTVNEDFDAYTPMVAVKAGTTAKACAALVSGETGCTE
ncbi:XRE family transcriptional regulator [Streptomyces alboniger]|uniref:XRE family transcriptional regulator n=2 Tax=Streptomyces alboniger TaxID=132473 RepID=A0A5J6HVX1_STRAD|nr:XRE family transcriptional regulator [Streptomyces alboniger]QEV22471.1 XRE family transcriptional regulator [Streptomyces alboniger]